MSQGKTPIDKALDYVAGSRWFRSLDLRNGYWHFVVAPKARAKTAFLIGQGLLQFCYMLFGLCNAPATFEQRVLKVHWGVEGGNSAPPLRTYAAATGVTAVTLADSRTGTQTCGSWTFWGGQNA